MIDGTITRKKVLAVLTTFTLLAASVSHAGELSALINGKSLHVGAEQDWNENNYGFGLEYEFASQSQWKWRVMANGFIDSVDNTSYMAGGGLHRRIWDTNRFHGLQIDVGLNAFLMTRADVNNNKPFPGALPSLSVSNRYVGANIAYLPRKGVEIMYDSEAVDRGISGIVFFQLKLKAELFALMN